MKPAEIRAEPSTETGVAFLDASSRRSCLWPLGGAGAELVVCGEARTAGSSYCQEHDELAHGAAHPPRIKVP
jgi:hypothetical protein